MFKDGDSVKITNSGKMGTIIGSHQEVEYYGKCYHVKCDKDMYLLHESMMEKHNHEVWFVLTKPSFLKMGWRNIGKILGETDSHFFVEFENGDILMIEKYMGIRTNTKPKIISGELNGREYTIIDYGEK